MLSWLRCVESKGPKSEVESNLDLCFLVLRVCSLPMRFWVNILRNPHFIFDVHVTEVVDASLHVIAQTFMDACTKTEHKLSRVSPAGRFPQRAASWKPDGSNVWCVPFVSASRSLRATSCSTLKRFPRIRRWWTSECWQSRTFRPWIQSMRNELFVMCCQQLLQGHQPDGSSQWPGHEHAPCWGVPGTSLCVGNTRKQPLDRPPEKTAFILKRHLDHR